MEITAGVDEQGSAGGPRRQTLIVGSQGKWGDYASPRLPDRWESIVVRSRGLEQSASDSLGDLMRYKVT